MVTLVELAQARDNCGPLKALIRPTEFEKTILILRVISTEQKDLKDPDLVATLLWFIFS